MKLAIIAVLVLHLALVVFCFGFAIYQPERSGLLPILVYGADYPASFLAEWPRKALHDTAGLQSYTGRLLADAFSYVLVGCAWWLLLGLLARRLARAVFTRAA